MKKNKLIPFILAVLVIAVVVVVYVIFNNSQINPTNGENATDASTEDGGMDIPEEIVENILSTTEIPDEMADNLQVLKDKIMADGYEEDDYKYLGCLFGTDLYCSIRYYEELDVLSLVSSYYTKTPTGASLEVLAVLNDFPSSTKVEYYEDYYAYAEADGEASSVGTLKAEAIYNPVEFTSESSLEFALTEDSDYSDEEENMENVFDTAAKYSMMSFSFWDEMLEMEFELNLKDFGFEKFVREDYTAE